MCMSRQSLSLLESYLHEDVGVAHSLERKMNTYKEQGATYRLAQPMSYTVLTYMVKFSNYSTYFATMPDNNISVQYLRRVETYSLCALFIMN